LHLHPKGSETFYIVEGNYEFILDGNSVIGKPGEKIFVPKGILHRFVVGDKGGHALVISPPELEFYFF
jgi:quercetin dioxygenase-like cupin family protein